MQKPEPKQRPRPRPVPQAQTSQPKTPNTTNTPDPVTLKLTPVANNSTLRPRPVFTVPDKPAQVQSSVPKNISPPPGVRNIGDMSPDKGKLKGNALVSLDMVPACVPEQCPIVQRCVYQNGEVQTVCTFQVVYMKAVVRLLQKAIGKDRPMDNLRVGMLIMPLFMQLVQLKMVQESFPTSIGRVVNPMFKEIREVIKAIDSLMKSLSGDGRNIGGNGSNGAGTGESGFYESLFDLATNPAANQTKAQRRKVLKGFKSKTQTIQTEEANPDELDFDDFDDGADYAGDDAVTDPTDFDDLDGSTGDDFDNSVLDE